MRCFVTGISGFAGVHLAAVLARRGDQVFGMSREPSRALAELHERHADRVPASGVEYFDIRDRERLRAAIRRTSPDAVFHLAGLSFPLQSFAQPDMTYAVNFLGTVDLFGAILDHAPGARVVCVTTGQVYGAVDDPSELPLTEEHPLRPLTPYAVAKAAADLAAYQFFRAHGLDVVRARPFNYTGPRQTAQFVCSEFARAIATAERGSGERTLRVGDLAVERDFSDVRDVVRGYVALVERGAGGEPYNLGSGCATSVGAILAQLRELSLVDVKVERDPAKLRGHDVPRIVGSIAKIREAVGWRPEIPLRPTLADLLEFWREDLARASS
jgi:GDP-4-dehydro-6-deoxy-D-mannose reductase